MERGAVGYCHSHAGREMLTQVATVVANQGLWVGPNLLQRLIRASPTAWRQGKGGADWLEAPAEAGGGRWRGHVERAERADERRERKHRASARGAELALRQ